MTTFIFVEEMRLREGFAFEKTLLRSAVLCRIGSDVTMTDPRRQTYQQCFGFHDVLFVRAVWIQEWQISWIYCVTLWFAEIDACAPLPPR